MLRSPFTSLTYRFALVNQELDETMVSHVSAALTRYQSLHAEGWPGCVRWGGNASLMLVGAMVKFVTGYLVEYGSVFDTKVEDGG